MLGYSTNQKNLILNSENYFQNIICAFTMLKVF